MSIHRVIKRNSSLTVGTAFQEFIAEKEACNLSEATIRCYQQSYYYFIKYNSYTDNTDIRTISQNNFYDWINAMKQSNISPASINHYLRDCRAFFYWCMDKDYLPPFHIKLIKSQEEVMKCFKDNDIMALLVKPKDTAPFSEWRTWVIVNWVLGTGNRSSTICEIQIGDIDYKAKEIVLRHTKNKRAQIIPLSSSLETVIKEYIHIWRRGASPDEWLFPNVGAEQLTTNSLRHSFSKYCKNRGVQQTNIHGLRHNFGRGWIKNNGNMFALQKILGHQTLEMVRNYVKLSVEDIKEDYDVYSPLDNIKHSATKRTHLIKRYK